MAAYMAPEALLRSEASPASDMWSLGAILYELATLRRPDFLKGREPAEVFVDGWRPDLSAVADGFIKGILERIFVLEPERRLTAGELYKTLTAAAIPVSELGHRHKVLEEKYNSLEIAVSNNNDRVALLEEDAKAKSTKIDALEDQGKEHLTMIKALENRFTQSSSETNTSGSQTNLSLLTELMRAAHTNNVRTTKMLVTRKVSIGQRDERGMTALMHAAQQGHIDPVNLLVEKEKGLKDKRGWTALMHAAHENHFEIVEILAPHEHGKRSKNDRTALMIAAENGHAETASVLAPYEKDLIDSEGNTALILAAEAGHEAVVEALDPIDDKGVTALMRAARRNDTLTARALIPIQKGRAASTGTALIQAAVCGHVTMVRLLMRYEGGARNSCGATALMRAASMNHIKVVQLLMEREGCMKDVCGVPAITHAAYSGHLEIVKLLFEKEGHLIDKSDKLFFSELEAMGYSEIASFLRNSSIPGADDCNDH
ncbi:Kinase, NEK [Giardia lamblia P15]|uniref:Kinase, NEK n=1 Tax=Giardia intestinalis (strain P15) TaxID=658858 RepID=E1F959_GIAIA|nr:Kinase, NEK [Giardia lamblia P15]